MDGKRSTSRQNDRAILLPMRSQKSLGVPCKSMSALLSVASASLLFSHQKGPPTTVHCFVENWSAGVVTIAIR